MWEICTKNCKKCLKTDFRDWRYTTDRRFGLLRSAEARRPRVTVGAEATVGPRVTVGAEATVGPRVTVGSEVASDASSAGDRKGQDAPYSRSFHRTNPALDVCTPEPHLVYTVALRASWKNGPMRTLLAIMFLNVLNVIARLSKGLADL